MWELGTKLNFKIKLNQFIIATYAVVLAVVILTTLLQYNLAKEKIEQGYIDKYYTKSIQARENIKFIRDSIDYKFMLSESSNIQTLNTVYDIYKNSDGNIDLEKTVDTISENLKYGTYEIALINKENIIEKTSYKLELGYDLGQFPYIKSLFADMFNKKITMDISPPTNEGSSSKLKKYFTRLSHDGKYIIQVAYLLDFISVLNKQGIQANTQEVYLIDDHAVVSTSVLSVNKKLSQKDSQKKTKILLTRLKKYSNIDINKLDTLMSKYNDNVTADFSQDILDIFISDNTPTMYVDEESINFFTKIETFFGSSNPIRVVTHFLYPKDELKLELSDMFKKSLIILFTAILFLSMIYFYIVTNISNKIIKISRSIMKNEHSDEDNIIIDELNSLHANYNRLHGNLNSEVQKNKKLLNENKRFIADTIHQIRTPLSVIMMNSDMINLYQQDENISDFIEQINSAINMLTNSYEDLSYITSHDSMKYVPTQLSLSKAVTQRVDFFKTIAKVNAKSIVTDIEDGIVFNINQIEFERMVDNNLSNAVKYAQKNKRISLSLKKESSAIVLSFYSYGEMIKDNKAVFDKDYREHHEKRGLGLGLNMVKLICEKYRIRYELKYEDNQNIFTYIFKI